MNFGGTIRLNKFGILIIVCIIFVFALHQFSKSTQNTSGIKTINLRTLFNVAVKAAINGGKKVVESKNNVNVKSKGLTKEGLPERVTNADFLSHCDMVNTIRHYFPKISLISEEQAVYCDTVSSDNYVEDVDKISDIFVNEEDITVWIDPLDATYEYTENLYSYVTTMVCVAVSGKPIIGVIHKPFDNKTSWAWVGKTLSADLKVQGSINEHNNLKVIVSRSHKGDVENILRKNIKQKIEIITAAGAGYKVLEVAKNKVDAYVHITAIKKWDICAGNAVINALNGKMLDKFGDELDYGNKEDVVNENGLIASIYKYEEFIGKLNLEN